MSLTNTTVASEDVRKHWDERAVAHGASPAATTNDVCLRLLEQRTLIDVISTLDLPASAAVLDVGCGDGRVMAALAERYTAYRFTGVDFSPSMIANAREISTGSSFTFLTGDARDLASVRLEGPFDVGLSVRCLINLTDFSAQQQAIQQIASCVVPGGYYLAIENFREGHDSMNAARGEIGLPEIPVRWHNRYFTDAEFVEAITPYFELLDLRNFASAYYYATRIIYSRLCQIRGVEPDYEHDLHRLAIDLPPLGNFSPVRLAILRRLAE